MAEKYSVVIPIYNSEPIVGETIRRVAAFFEGQGWSYEIILVNDGSRDNSWKVIKASAAENPNVVAVNLLRNRFQLRHEMDLSTMLLTPVVKLVMDLGWDAGKIAAPFIILRRGLHRKKTETGVLLLANAPDIIGGDRLLARQVTLHQVIVVDSTALQ